MAAENSLFSGLKKLLFKDGDGAGQPADAPPPFAPEPLPASPVQQQPQQQQQSSQPLQWDTTGAAPDEATRTKAYQMLESINQPGVDFMEVWNAAEESGGVAAVKSVFNALKYADKSLTKEKVLSTGRFYIDALQKTLDADLQKKSAQRQQIEDEKKAQRKSLSDTVASIEQQIAALQASLTDKRAALTDLDAQYEPRLQELGQRMSTGKVTIEALLQQMRTVLATAERDL